MAAVAGGREGHGDGVSDRRYRRNQEERSDSEKAVVRRFILVLRAGVIPHAPVNFARKLRSIRNMLVTLWLAEFSGMVVSHVQTSIDVIDENDLVSVVRQA